MRTLALLLLVVGTLSACAGDKVAERAADSVATAALTPPVVTIVAKDFSYEAPDTVAGGMVTLRLVNQGPEFHHVQLLKLSDGKTVADLESGLKAMKPGEPMPSWVHEVAGPNTPLPGGEQTTTQELEPGDYAIICFIPSADKVPHAMKGMVRALTVIPATAPSAPAPTADITVSMTDYAWSVSPALSSGKHTIRIENMAEQAHEMFIAQLEPGKTAEELAVWIENPQGPAPGKPIGGISGMGKGAVVYLPVDLAPGEYGLYCFLPDAKDGKPHIVHGMITQVTVQ